MRWRITAIIGLTWFAVGAVGAQQSGAGQVDVDQWRQESEILKGILETTLRYAGDQSWEGRIQAYYLKRQGAVFIIPAKLQVHDFSGDLQRLERLIEQASSGQAYSQELLNSMYRRLESVDFARAIAGELAGVAAGVEGVVAPLPPAPPAPPEAPAPPAEPAAPSPPAAPPEPPEPVVTFTREPEMAEAYREAYEERLKAFEERLEQRKARLEKEQQENQARLAELSERLIEALAKYGDTLTLVGNGEFVTLILTPNTRFPLGFHRTQGPTRVLSVSRKSIVDYNAGRLTLDAFKAQVVDYEL